MLKRYQFDYAAGRPQMYDRKSREQKARRIIKTLKDFFGKNLDQLTLLDLGSSTGIIDNLLASAFEKVVGIDIDKEAVRFAKKNFKKKNLEFRIGDAMNLDFPPGSFDVLICAHTYEHVPDQTKLFSEIHRILKSGGVCYLAAQNRLWPWEKHYNLFFLSWLPKSLANVYIKIARGMEEYYETPRTYWGLRSLTKNFTVIDYTDKILRNPQKLGYADILRPPISYAAFVLSPLAKIFSPVFFWLLKRENDK